MSISSAGFEIFNCSLISPRSAWSKYASEVAGLCRFLPFLSTLICALHIFFQSSESSECGWPHTLAVLFNQDKLISLVSFLQFKPPKYLQRYCSCPTLLYRPSHSLNVPWPPLMLHLPF